MRIISGSRKGQKLFEFNGMDIRPTTDRVRESMFNLIMDFVYDANVLDLFGGSGALSLEALSRGAKKAVICDIDIHSISLIKKNAEKLRFCDRVIIKKISAMDFLKEYRDSFDIIFLDPPYNKGFIRPVIEGVVASDKLSKDGIIVLESDFIDEHGEFDGIKILKQRKYGRSYITIYQRGVD